MRFSRNSRGAANRKPERGKSFGIGTMIGLSACAAVFAAGIVFAQLPLRERAGELKTQGFYSEVPTTRVALVENDPQELAGARPVEANSANRYSVRFELCGSEVRTTCVVDGDTFWLGGSKIRVADIDTPEVSEPRCASEKALGDQATLRLLRLLNVGPFELHPVGDRDEDRYGRKLRVVTRGGQSLGDQLVREGLARTWTGAREPWC